MNVYLYDLVMALSRAVDLVSPVLSRHHADVAYIAYRIGEEMKLPHDRRNALFLAGALHDIGALSLQERLDLQSFEVGGHFQHEDNGYTLLSMFAPLSVIAGHIRYHHVPWEDGKGEAMDGNPVSLESHILHLADRVSVLMDGRDSRLGRAREIPLLIQERVRAVFRPEVVEAFSSLASREYFWLDIGSAAAYAGVGSQVKLASVQLDIEQTINLTKMFSQIIDYRSPFTATHSSGVAASAIALARLIGFSDHECLAMKVAGYLHDLGKLSVGSEILEKPGKLTDEEFMVVKAHTYHTYRILESIPGMEQVNEWAAFHHERLDGKGYPFHHGAGKLPLGSRVMAVADVFTALAEDRPYRKGMDGPQILKILDEAVVNNHLDHEVVLLLKKYYGEINGLRLAAQNAAAADYERFRAGQGKESVPN
jgi:HD-GYP domain-containing protein (c-di-GMP phosphodiesterase class II)